LTSFVKKFRALLRKVLIIDIVYYIIQLINKNLVKGMLLYEKEKIIICDIVCLG